MVEIARVTERTGQKVKVRFIMSEGCHACSSSDTCASAEGRVLEADLPSGMSVRVGQAVRIVVPASSHLWGMLWLVLFPVLLFGAGYMGGQRWWPDSGEGPAALAGIIGLVFGLLIAVLISRLGRFAARPRVLGPAEEA